MHKITTPKLKSEKVECAQPPRRHICNPFRYLEPMILISTLKEHGKDMPEDVRGLIEEVLDDSMPDQWKTLVEEADKTLP